MLWEIEIQPQGSDLERERVCEEYDLLTHSRQGHTLISRSARGYLVEGDLDVGQAATLVRELLVDPLAETVEWHGVSGEWRGKTE
jgi:phosphoribosylformylglycinamidine synthase